MPDSNYSEIKIPAGCSLKTAVQLLISKTVLNDELVFCEFEGVKLYSDTVSLDSAYKQITGKSYQEYELASSLSPEEKMINDMIARGHRVIIESKWPEWDDYVPCSVNGIYAGKDIKGSLEIMESLSNDNSETGMRAACKILKQYDYNSTLVKIIQHIVYQYYADGSKFINTILSLK